MGVGSLAGAAGARFHAEYTGDALLDTTPGFTYIVKWSAGRSVLVNAARTGLIGGSIGRHSKQIWKEMVKDGR